MGSVIQMYFSAAPAAALATIDVPQDGRIVGVEWNVSGGITGADFDVAVQLSFGSSSSVATNDARQVISMCRVAQDFTTSGASPTACQYYSNTPNVRVFGGERIYLHATGTAITVVCNCLIFFDFDMPGISSRRP